MLIFHIFSHTTSLWPHLSQLWNDSRPWREMHKNVSAAIWKTMTKCMFLAKVALKSCLTLCVVGKVVCLFYNNQHIRRMAFNSVNTGERVCVFMWRDCGRIYSGLQVAWFKKKKLFIAFLKACCEHYRSMHSWYLYLELPRFNNMNHDITVHLCRHIQPFRTIKYFLFNAYISHARD